jgi:predicted MFS family arabinose efflux permease
MDMSDNLSIFSSDTVWGILARFGINLVFLVILIGFIYFRYSKKEKFLFTFFLIGIVVFLVSSIMKRIDIGLGLAFVLFAIFGILRLRTRNFSIKDMAYLFASIGISVINSLGMLVLPVSGILVINVMILLSSLALELFLMKNNFKKHTIVYDEIDLLLPENKDKLLADVSSKTGRDIIKVKIRKIDFKKDTAELDIFFKD